MKTSVPQSHNSSSLGNRITIFGQGLLALMTLLLVGIISIILVTSCKDKSPTESRPEMPSAPTNLVAIAASVSQINLSWTDNSNNETGFKIERAPSGTDNFAEIVTVSANVTSYQNTGLAASTSYKYRVRASNSAGNSGYSNTVTASTQGTGVPLAPTNLTATGVSASQINLSWQDNSNNETGFKIERAPGGTGNFAEIATVSANVTSYQNTGLAASTSYSFRIRAYNSAGNSGYSNIATATTPSSQTIPVAPSNLTANPVSSSQINLTWNDNSNNEDGFKVERAPGGTTNFAQIVVLSVNTTSYQNSNLNASTTYKYRVRSYNATGNSGYSNEVAATTNPSGTQSLVVTPSFDNTLAYSNIQGFEGWKNTVFNLGKLAAGNQYYHYLGTSILGAVECFAILKFNLPTQVYNKTITNATIKLTVSTPTGATYYNVIYKIAAVYQDWNPNQITYANSIGTGNFLIITGSEQLFAPPKNRNNSVQINVKAIVQKWVNGEWNNFGFLVWDSIYLNPNEDYTYWPLILHEGTTEFYSKDDNANNESFKPTLEIEYR